MILLLVATASLVAVAEVSAQVGSCYICDEGDEISPCQGSMSGSEQCAQMAPGECDMYGGVCVVQTALDVTPSGTISLSEEIRALVAASPAGQQTEGPGLEILACGTVVDPAALHRTAGHRSTPLSRLVL